MNFRDDMDRLFDVAAAHDAMPDLAEAACELIGEIVGRSRDPRCAFGGAIAAIAVRADLHLEVRTRDEKGIALN
jgi:hypothetical protein